MIKKFDDFNIDDTKNNEREHFERELNARKKMREEKEEPTDSEFQDIKSFIVKEISNEEDYQLTTGTRMVTIEGVKKEELHIEFQSPQAGRIRIFKPEDTSTKGYFEVNGKINHADAEEIRGFYHFLNQELKQKPIINESVRELMKPKSEEEINEAWQRMIDKLFEQAYNHGTDFNRSEFRNGIWKKCTKKYFLYDNFYLYKDKIIYLQKSDTTFDALFAYKTIEEFKLESEDKIKEIKLALKKL